MKNSTLREVFLKGKYLHVLLKGSFIDLLHVKPRTVTVNRFDFTAV